MKNRIAQALKIIGIVDIVGAIIGGISMMAAADVVYGLLILIVGFIGGMMFVGFAEIIKLLQIGVNQRDELLNREPAPQPSVPNQDNWEASLPEL